MAHGGYNKRRVADGKPGSNRRPKSLGVGKKLNSKPKLKSSAKPKSVSLKNQIRSTERMLRKDLPAEVKVAQTQKLDELKKQQDLQDRLALERKMFLRNRKIRFFERRKIDRKIKRLESQQRTSTNEAQEAEIAEQLAKLKEDLEYVRFFPKTEKYVPLFVGVDDPEVVEKSNKLRKQIKDNIVAAAASGKDLEETGNEDDGLVDACEDDFFLAESSNDEADADDQWTDKSTREPTSIAYGKAESGMSNDEKNQRQISARPSSRSKDVPVSSNEHKSRGRDSTSKKAFMHRPEISAYSNTSRGKGFPTKKPFIHKAEFTTSSNTSNSFSGPSSFSKRGPADSHKSSYNVPSSFGKRGPADSHTSSFNGPSAFSKRGPADSHTSSFNGPSFRKSGPADVHTANNENSEPQKPRRKRRPKKKKQQA